MFIYEIGIFEFWSKMDKSDFDYVMLLEITNDQNKLTYPF